MNDSTPSLVDLYNLKQEYGVDNHYSISDSNVVVTSNSGEVVNTLSVSDIPKSTASYETTESTNTGDNLRDRGYSSSMDGYNPSKSKLHQILQQMVYELFTIIQINIEQFTIRT